MTGAAGPKPLIPSCTTLPEVIATSTTRFPHAPPTVPISTPSSSVQALGAITRPMGLRGNTQPGDTADPVWAMGPNGSAEAAVGVAKASAVAAAATAVRGLRTR